LVLGTLNEYRFFWWQDILVFMSHYVSCDIPEDSKSFMYNVQKYFLLLLIILFINCVGSVLTQLHYKLDYLLPYNTDI